MTRFRLPNGLRLHALVHRPDPDAPLRQCGQCGIYFTDGAAHALLCSGIADYLNAEAAAVEAHDRGEIESAASPTAAAGGTPETAGCTRGALRPAPAVNVHGTPVPDSADGGGATTEEDSR